VRSSHRPSGCNGHRHTLTQSESTIAAAAARIFADSSRLVVVSGAKVPTGREVFGHDVWGREFIQHHVTTSGLVWDDGVGGRQPSTGWWFVYWDSAGPALVQTLSVERDCFIANDGDGSTSMYVNSMRNNIQTPASATGDAFWCTYDERSRNAGPGYTGWRSAALTMTGISLPGWGFVRFAQRRDRRHRFRHGRPCRTRVVHWP
jgi:hypothetical protein